MEPQHRFFLALLMNAPSREELLALVGQQFPRKSPAAVVTRWVEEMADMSDETVIVLDATFPETVDVAADDRPDVFLSAFHYFLEQAGQRPAALQDLSDSDLEALRAAFATSALGLLVA